MINDNERKVTASEGVSGWLLRQPEKVVVWWVAVSCAALGLGSLGTWEEGHLAGYTVTASGLDGWGKLTLAAAVLTVVPVVQPGWIEGWAWGARHYLDAALVFAWASLAACVYNLLNSNGNGYAVPGITSPGWGLYLATLASVILIVSTIGLRRATR